MLYRKFILYSKSIILYNIIKSKHITKYSKKVYNCAKRFLSFPPAEQFLTVIRRAIREYTILKILLGGVL